MALVEDQGIVRRAMKEALHRFADLVIVAEGGTTSQAVVIGKTGGIDVMVLDLSMPDVAGHSPRAMSGLDVLRDIGGMTRIVVLTSYDDVATGVDVMRAGAYAYVRKTDDLDELVYAIREASAGKRFAPPDVVSALGGSL